MGKKDKGKKGKPLTGLAAALVKSGHLSEKKAKTLTREQRREEKSVGRDELARLEDEKRARLAAERAAEAVAARERELGRAEGETLERARRLIRNKGAVSGGGRRWFFVARDQRVLFLDLADDVAGMLARGGAGIVESLGEAPSEHVVIVGERDLGTLLAIDPGLVRFWNRELA